MVTLLTNLARDLFTYAAPLQTELFKLFTDWLN